MTDPNLRTDNRQSLPEFIAMQAVIMALVAFSIDSMLPALPEIARVLTPDNVNRAQLVLTAFMAGMSLGTLGAGPLSDAFGRKPVMTLGFIIYAVAAFAAIFANSLWLLLLARFLQGFGAAAPRIVGLAMVRDLYQGREMARITSFVMMIFILVPAIAPSLGTVVIHVAGWRGVFASFILLAILGASWLNLRRGETLPAPRRVPLSVGNLVASAREVIGDAQVRLVIVVMALGFGQMFALLSSSQQIYADLFGKTDSFPTWFAVMALLSGTGTMLNVRYVVRLGMKRIVTMAYAMQTVVSAVMLVLVVTGVIPENLRFAVFFAWAVSVFFMAGITFGNLNAIAMQRKGHIAGMTASIVAAASTLGAVLIAAPVGLMFDGSLRPLVAATLICSGAALLLMRRVTENEPQVNR